MSIWRRYFDWFNDDRLGILLAFLMGVATSFAGILLGYLAWKMMGK